jgi:hypothetical protein
VAHVIGEVIGDHDMSTKPAPTSQERRS